MLDPIQGMERRGFLLILFFVGLILVGISVFFAIKIFQPFQQNIPNSQLSLESADPLGLTDRLENGLNISTSTKLERDDQSTIKNNSGFKTLNKNYVVSGGELYYFFTPHIVGWLKDIKTNEDFQEFLKNPPEQLDYIQPLYAKVSNADISSLKTISDYDYISDKNNVYYASKRLAGVATSTARAVNKVLISGDSAYYKGEKLTGVDTKTFTSTNKCSDLGGSFVKLYCPSSYYDANNLYFVNNGEGPITMLDRSSFREITSSYFADKNDVYIKIGYIETNELIPLRADPKTFQLLLSGFSRDKDSLFFGTNATWSNDASAKIKNGDPSSFVNLQSFYAKDKNHVYVVTRPYEGLSSSSILNSADPTSFTVLNDGVGLARDTDTIFLFAKILEQADPSAFRVLTPLNEKGNFLDGVYAVDDSVAYFFERYEVPSSPKQKVIQDADISSLTNVDGIYAKDNNSVYIRGKKIENVNPATFSSLGYGFAVDGSRVYGSSFNTYDFGYEFQVSCSSCNLSSFIMLNTEYARDSSNVFYYDSRNHEFTPLAQADLDTFQVSDTEDIHKAVDAQDKNHSYKDGKIVP